MWFQYGGRKKYEEHLQWEMEKEALRQATAERDERNRKKREARERRRLLEKEKRLRLQTIAIQEIQRYVFSKNIYFVCSLIFTSLVNLLLQFFIIIAFPLVNVFSVKHSISKKLNSQIK